ncbi:hypothetical protein FOZ63_008206, partial [Perkinsus olseni]
MSSKRFLLSLLMIVGVSAQDLVNPHRTCSENGFCNRFRDWARLPIDKRGIYYVPDGKLPAICTGVYKVPVKSSRITKLDEPILEAELHFYSDNTVRFTVDENSKLVENGRKRYRIPSGDVIQDSQLQPHGDGRKSTFDLGDSTLVQLDHDTVVLALIVDGRVVQTLNEKQMFE